MATDIVVALEAADISVSGHLLLQDVSLILRQGVLTIINGPGGSGKSQLLKVFWGALRLSHGKILCNQREMTRASANRWAAWRRQVGILCDDFPLGEQWSVFENVAAALYSAEKLPEKIITRRTNGELRTWGLLSRRHLAAHTLSSSERIRLRLARAFVRGPKAAFLDFALENLPEAEQKSLLSIVRTKAHAGSAVCLATVGEPAIPFTDNVYRIEDKHLTLTPGAEPARAGS